MARSRRRARYRPSSLHEGCIPIRAAHPAGCTSNVALHRCPRSTARTDYLAALPVTTAQPLFGEAAGGPLAQTRDQPRLPTTRQPSAPESQQGSHWKKQQAGRCPTGVLATPSRVPLPWLRRRGACSRLKISQAPPFQPSREGRSASLRAQSLPPQKRRRRCKIKTRKAGQRFAVKSLKSVLQRGERPAHVLLYETGRKFDRSGTGAQTRLCVRRGKA